jgi:hypothetical protein
LRVNSSFRPASLWQKTNRESKKKIVWTPDKMKFARRLYIRNCDMIIIFRLGCLKKTLEDLGESHSNPGPQLTLKRIFSY